MESRLHGAPGIVTGPGPRCRKARLGSPLRNGPKPEPWRRIDGDAMDIGTVRVRMNGLEREWVQPTHAGTACRLLAVSCRQVGEPFPQRRTRALAVRAPWSGRRAEGGRPSIAPASPVGEGTSSGDGSRREGAPGMDYGGRPPGTDKRAKQGGANHCPGKAIEIFTLLTTEAHDDITEKPPRVRRAPIAVG